MPRKTTCDPPDESALMLTIMRQWFSRFLRRRQRLRHFGRHLFADALARQGPAQPAAPQLALELQRASEETPDAAIARSRSHADGLTQAEARKRLARIGPNEVEHEKPLPAWLHLWLCYKNPFNLLLSALALLSFLSEDAKATVVIGCMVGLSTVIRFVQEGRSHRAAESLKAMVGNRATVIRRTAGADQGSSAPMDLPLRELVPGDLVALSAGDMIPADCRLLSARGLHIAQSALTGESLPVEKFALTIRHQDKAATDGPLERSNLVFMGTNVVSGTATALVLVTGSRSYFGSLASSAMASDPEPNAFQTGVNSVSWLLIRFALVMVPIVLLVNGFTKGDWIEASLFALSVAVGLTPEMLPMVVTTTLAKGAVLLSRKKVVVKRLDAIQNFGAMDMLCTDKTGTLSLD